MIRILFGILATLGVLTALGTVLARNLVHAALFLVAFFFLVACQFVLLEAEFMAAMQVLVYIGAVAIILMFGIMLTRNIQGDETTGSHWTRKLPAVAVAAAMLALLIAGIFDEKPLGTRQAWMTITARPEARIPDGRPTTADFMASSTDSDIVVDRRTRSIEGLPVDSRSLAISDMSRSVGIEMLQRFVIPFEIAGLLLTAAVVGAIALAQSEEREDSSRSGASGDVRGGTTLQPAPGFGVEITPLSNGSSTPAAGAKLHPASDTPLS